MVSSHFFLPRHSPLLNVEGKVVYWLLAGLLLMIVLFGGILWRHCGGTADKESPPVTTPNRNEARLPPQRYKIERLPGPVVEDIGSETPPHGQGDEMVEARARSARTDGPADQQTMTPSPVTGQGPLASMPEGKSIFDQERLGAGDRDDAIGPSVDKALSVPALDVHEKAGAVSSEEGGISPRPPANEYGKRYFVRVDAANVRDLPGTHSKVAFQIRSGGSVTVTEKREGWYSIKTDSGRSGWVHHTLLAESLVPHKDVSTGVREIKAIRVEGPVNQTMRVLFELSAPCIPEILFLDKEMPRVVCDFIDAKSAPDIGHRMVVKKGIVQTIRIGLHQHPLLKVRVVLDLAPGRRYETAMLPGEGENTVVLEIRAVEKP